MTISKCFPEKKNKLNENENKTFTRDGGWGWIVCFAAFMINFIADGTMFSFGIIFIELLDYFKDSKFKTSIVGSSQLGLSMMMGPVVSVLLKHFTCRQVTITGGFIAAISLVLSVFSPNIDVMIITYGILCGSGICMMYMTAIIAVGLYFNERRAIATGISTSGAGVGVFVYGYLMDYLLEIYDWKGAVLILAGLMFNCIVCGALFRPRQPSIQDIEHFEISSSSSGYCGSNSQHVDSESEEECESIKADQIVTNHHKHNSSIRYQTKTQSADELNLLSVKAIDPRLHVSSFAVSKITLDSKSERIAMGLLNPMLRKDIFYSGSVSQLPDYKQCDGSLNSFLAQMTRDKSITNDMESHIISTSQVKSLYDITILKDNIFWVLLFTCTLWTVQSITITYVPGLAVSNGIDRSKAALLISIVGIANTFGRIIAGFANDFFKIRSSVLYFCALLVGAVVNYILPFCGTFPLIATCTAGFGLCMAIAVSMRTIVIADLMKIERLTQSFGLISFAQGAAFIFNPPIAGALMDFAGTYIAPFFMAASLYVLSAILSLILVLKKRSQGR
ncbi:hypothetical protein LOTGIDRAFT_230540 [Lottia gigantea]|uniref:Major facilitator superfamily (MFS) profile domain-containing protein n=1 Tax=Lottia gigantea TaxID=225164 RepID=V4CIK6_LOTGI|nr:hypothetical protein LOTGIDRAFT_230540 [Lottia gigantea]ESP02005.1 hypothetical protein LOTGIDRAFT_230540 [Lottia gigantea]